MSRAAPARDIDVYNSQIYREELGQSEVSPGLSGRSSHLPKQSRHDAGAVVRRTNSMSRGYGVANNDGYADEPPALPARSEYADSSQRSKVEKDRGGRDRGRRQEGNHWSNFRSKLKGARAESRDRDSAHGRSRDHPSEVYDTETIDPRDAYLKEVKDLQVELRQAMIQIEAQKGEIQKRDELISQLKRRNNAMQSSQDAEEELYGRQEQDSAIKGEFEHLFYQVKSWAAKFCTASSSRMEITGAHRDQFAQIRRVLPSLRTIEDLPDFLPPGETKRRRQFVRGWVGLMMTETMVRSLSLPEAPYTEDIGQDYWLPSRTRDSVRELENTLVQKKPGGEAITSTAFHGWRTITMSLLGQKFPYGEWPSETTVAVEKVVDSTLEIILPLTPQPESGEIRQKLINNVFVPALRLSQHLRRQRACWNIRFPIKLQPSNIPPHEQTSTFMFDHKVMTDNDSQSEDDTVDAVNHCLKPVEIAITPSLLKAGNHDGLKYGTLSCVEKAEVSCASFRMG